MTNREVMQQALEALEDERYVSSYTHIVAAITALKVALAQPEQEPSQWRDMVVVTLVREGINKHKARELADHFATPPAAAQPLTATTIGNMMPSTIPMEYDGALMEFARAIEAKLKERNNGP